MKDELNETYLNLVRTKFILWGVTITRWFPFGRPLRSLMTLHGRLGRTDEASGVPSSIWNNQGATDGSQYPYTVTPVLNIIPQNQTVRFRSELTNSIPCKIETDCVFSVCGKACPYTWTWFCRAISPGTPRVGWDFLLPEVTRNC